MERKWHQRDFYGHGSAEQNLKELAEFLNRNQLKPGEVLVVPTCSDGNSTSHHSSIRVGLLYYSEKELE